MQLLTSEGIQHSTEVPTEMAHRWDSGWVPLVLSGFSPDSAALQLGPIDALSVNRGARG